MPALKLPPVIVFCINRGKFFFIFVGLILEALYVILPTMKYY